MVFDLRARAEVNDCFDLGSELIFFAELLQSSGS